MDKTAIKNFAVEARKQLMKTAITEAGFYGITKDGCKDPVQRGNDFEVYETVAGTENRIFGDDIKRRANLVTAIKEQGFDQVIEETAYTWFNRIIAIRFMEVNNYLPTRVRVLSSETGSTTPDIVTQSDTVELNLSSDELERIQTAKRENRYDDAFRSLFIKQCNELNTILPGLFEKTDDYMELLLKITYTGDGVIRMLVDSIPEDNFNVETEGQVEIIGWMYQYYNTELKDDTFAKLKKNVKITKERIPAATQLFTPDWIVRYMVENSLGRVWIEHLRADNPSVDEKAKAEEFGWKYYLPEAEQDDDVQAQLVEIRKSYKELTPQDITCIDPCMGSGHILVYMFDVLMDIYRSEGFSEREAVFDVLEKNIRGLDIDRRAYQLSYFALMMKARGYNRIFFRGHEDIDGNRVQAVPRVYAIEESNSIDREQLKYFGAGLDELSKNNAINQMNGLLDSLYDAKEYGSIINVQNFDWKLLCSFLSRIGDEGQGSLFGFMAYQSKPLLRKLIDIGELLSRKYDVVVTNPPYMGMNGYGDKLGTYIIEKYQDSKTDLYSVFIEKCSEFVKDAGLFSMITQQSWMFLATFEKLRSRLYKMSFINMAHLGSRAFDEISGEVVQTTSFCVRKNGIKGYRGAYKRLTDVSGENQKRDRFLSIDPIEMSTDILKHIPGVPFSYWISDRVLEVYKNERTFGDVFTIKKGSDTGENGRFVRAWYEVDLNKCDFLNHSKKWVPYLKGGDRRNWYGNYTFLVNWENDGYEIRHFPKSTIRNQAYFYKEGITWSDVGTSSFRIFPEGFLRDNRGPAIFIEGNEKVTYEYALAFLVSSVCRYIQEMINPTMCFQVGSAKAIPFVYDECRHEEIERLAKENISISREDWDSNETSWDFKRNPLVQISLNEKCGLPEAYEKWKVRKEKQFSKMRENEERINVLFSEIYGLQDVECTVEEDRVTISKPDIKKDMYALISYFVGCALGRYSLSTEGALCTGGNYDDALYVGPRAVKNGIALVRDEGQIEGDLLSKILETMNYIWGEQCDTALSFLAEAISDNDEDPITVIREYLYTSFYKYHLATYTATGSGKCPIYWMFDSGKQNGFKCLVYFHRYTADTVGLIRSDYLSKTQTMIENALKNAEYAIGSSASAVDKAYATKKRDKYIKQLAEIKAYYPALSHVALQRIELDLDDGVRSNYEKFQGIEVSVEGEKKQKVDLLAKL